MRTKLSAAGAGEAETVVQSTDNAVQSHFQTDQDRYLARCNERTGEVRLRTGDLVRVKAPFGWKRRFGPPLRITGQLGPVTFVLSDGQKVHARRLAAATGADRQEGTAGARSSQTKPAAEDEPEVWYPSQETDVTEPGPAPATPSLPTTPCPPQGRGRRARRVPNRYSP